VNDCLSLTPNFPVVSAVSSLVSKEAQYGFCHLFKYLDDIHKSKRIPYGASFANSACKRLRIIKQTLCNLVYSKALEIFWYSTNNIEQVLIVYKRVQAPMSLLNVYDWCCERNVFCKNVLLF